MPAGDAAHMEKLRAGQERARLERERQARAILGESATQEQIDGWVKQALVEQRRATRLQNEAKRSNKAAQKLMQQAAGKPPAPTTPPAPAATATLERPQYYTPPQSQAPAAPSHSAAAEALYEHSIFGGAVQPDRVQKVEIERLQSSRPEHQVRGAAPGWLEEVDFELFSKGYVRAKHGGGRFRATAKDAMDRVVAVKDFDIGGAAKPLEDDDGPAFLRGRPGAFQPEPETEAPPVWMRQFMSESQSRIERLESIVTSKSASELSPEEKLTLWKREQEAKAAAEDERRRRDREDDERRRKDKEIEEERRHERRMAELKAQVDADMARERERQKDTLAMFTQLMPKEQKSSEMAIVMPLLLESLKSKDNTMSTIFGMVKSMAKGEDSAPRTWKDRLIDIAEKGLDSAWESGLIANLVAGFKKPAATETPANNPAGMAFRLPDGRIVPPEICADFIAKYQSKHGQPPSAEVCVAAFTAFLNASQAAQLAAQQAPAQIAQQPQAPQQAPMPGGTLPRTQEQAEEMVRLAGQKAAETATAAGATPEQAQQAALQAQRQLIDTFNARMAAPQPPVSPAPAPAAVQAPPPPVPSPAALAAAQAAAPGPRPAPAPAALAAAQAASGNTSTLVEQAPPPADVVMTPWMAKGFMQDAADAFQAHQDAVDFLERASKLGKISVDARKRIGEIYNDSEEDAPIQDVLMAVKVELESRGVPVPLSLVPIFMGNDHGAAWIESLLFSCGCETFDQARKELREG